MSETPRTDKFVRQHEANRLCSYLEPKLIWHAKELELDLATAQSKIAALESDITRHVQIATDQLSEIAKLEEKRKADVGKCKLAVQFVRNKYVKSNNIGFRVVMECEAAIRAAFPEVFP